MSQHCSSCWPAQRFPIKKYKTFSVFPYSYRNTSGSLGEREIEVGTRARSASVSTQFRVLPNFHECFYNVWEHGKNVFYFSYKITRRKLNRGNSFLCQSVHSPYCWRWRIMAWTFPCFPYSLRNTAFSQLKLTISTCYFTNRSIKRLWTADIESKV